MNITRLPRLARLLPAGLLLAGTLAAQPGAQAANAPAYFTQTHHTVAGAFFDYWRTHGGVVQQGYPITEEFGEKSAVDGKTYVVQYFERAVFELHPENAPPYNVLLSPLGADALKRRYPAAAPGDQRVNKTIANQYFSQTGHTIGGGFWPYWQRGGGLAQFGLPLTDEFAETSAVDSKPYTVQYFERAVFEYHPNAPAGYGVQLSLLGAIRYQARYESGARFTRDNWRPAPGLVPTTAPLLFNAAFAAPSLTAWQTLPNPNVEDVPTWTVINGRLQQDGDSNGLGSADETVFLSGDPTWRDITLEAQMSCLSNVPVGLVWRAGGSHYYRFDLAPKLPNSPAGATMWRFGDGPQPVRVATVAPDHFPGYTRGQWYTVRISAQGAHHQISIDGVPVLDVQDSTLTQGRIGLYAYVDGYSAFDNVRVTAP
ncbi:MAG: DUF1080 domain-containing protein [Chloroflexota bacterium]|nr:DUF1080 domain-containing protein [Chloroflexota bacterium]